MFSASPESHAQDGEKLPRAHSGAGSNSVWRSCHGISNLALLQERSLSALAKLPAAPIAAGSTSERAMRIRCTKRTGLKHPARNKSSANAELLD
jgi:hypothetical protein